MSRLCLNATAYLRLLAQVNLSGTFHHTLRSTDGRTAINAQVAIEQCAAGIQVQVDICGIRRTQVTLDKSRHNNATRVASFIEGLANGRLPIGIPEVGEDELVSEIEGTLRQAIRLGHGTYHLIADELEPRLLINRTPRGYTARIELDDAQLHLTLPTDTQRAYDMLSDNMNRFLQGYRDSLAAAA